MAELAGRQHGVVGRRQLLELGVGVRQVDRLLGARQLHLIHLGVYAVGHPHLTQRGRWSAAVLAGGPGAALSHRSAGQLWQLLNPTPTPPDITTATAGRRRPGIHFHHSHIRTDERTIHDSIPTTTVARTLIDLASSLDAQQLERALAEAEYRRYTDSPSLPDLIRRHTGRRGLGTLRAVLHTDNARLGVTRSPLEDRFLRFLDRRGLARPELNAPLYLGDEVAYVDCLWRSAGIALELDGRAAHLRERSFERDRLRDRRLSAQGLRPVRVTSKQLASDPGGIAADLRALGVDRDTVSA